MKLEFRKISHLAICSLCLLVGLGGTAQASKSEVSTPHYSSFSTLESSSFDMIKAKEEDNDKLINNVKVFYNPISEQISVTFKLAKVNNITIKVMDALGNEVLSLHNGSLDAGMQNLSFDTQQKLSEGFYFVRVSGGSETIVKRISIRQ
ncbi:T9SS type A sorting domain-containing protein [Sphingobacterium mizutaii]|uniref:T9SS type A sorting domain-containing protein n=1 Tax=Sphingobacterium mizutaii TaxID=1010 RepID=UPI0016270BC3|nr:T9SS type A sorting domain-containing protein [Sphingobacterium mizutaii]